MTIRVSDTIAACRDLGFTARHADGEYRLARPLSAYRSYGSGAAGVQEVEAYYTDCPQDCLDTARVWAANIARATTVLASCPVRVRA